MKTPKEILTVNLSTVTKRNVTLAETLIEALEAGGFRIVKGVEPGEAQRASFDQRSYDVGYMEGENSTMADRDER